MLTNPDTVHLPIRRTVGWPPEVAVRGATTLAFTGLQAWALVLVVLHVELNGAVRLALAAALAAAVVTVLDAWRDVWTVARPGGRHRHLA